MTVRQFLMRNLRKIGFFLLFLLLLAVFFNAKAILILPALIVVASFSTYYFNYVSLPVNFELVKLSTILASAAFGFLPGLAVGVSSTFFGKVLIGRIDEKLPVSMLAISFMAVAASFIPDSGIAAFGLALVALYNIAMLGISILMGGDLGWNIPYEATNFLFNAFLFLKLAPVILSVIGYPM